MDLIEEQIAAYKRMIKYHEAQIRRLERKRNASRGEIFTERCCQSTTRIYLPLANKG